jgi:hypothetical protein
MRPRATGYGLPARSEVLRIYPIADPTGRLSPVACRLSQ